MTLNYPVPLLPGSSRGPARVQSGSDPILRVRIDPHNRVNKDQLMDNNDPMWGQFRVI